MLFSRKCIWIAGSAGSLGQEISRHLPSEEYDLLETDIDLDITNLETVKHFMDMHRPEVVINCAGFTDLDACEQDIVSAYKVNALGARNLAAASRKIGAKIIYISTDDVFAGDKAKALTEFDMPTPISVYGKSKLAGEDMVRELNPKHLIVRSSWVYGENPNSYVEKILREAKTKEVIEAPNDQISSPTSAKALAEFIVSAIESTEYGTYHASCEGSCTRYEFAKTIIELAGLSDKVTVNAGLLENLGHAFEVRCTLLRNLMMEMTGIYHMPHWKTALTEYMENRIKLD